MFNLARIAMGLGFVLASVASASAPSHQALTVCASTVQAAGNVDAYKAKLESRLATLRMDSSIKAFLIGMPPKEKPEFVSDIFVLLQHDSSRGINCSRLLRAEGIPVAISQGKPLTFPAGESSNAESFFDAIPSGSNFIGKHTTFFIGKSKMGNDQGEFRKVLESHVQHARANFQPRGLVGYVGLVAVGYEMTFMSWTSQKAMQDAFTSEEGKLVVHEAGTLLENVQFADESNFSHALEYNQLYRKK